MVNFNDKPVPAVLAHVQHRLVPAVDSVFAQVGCSRPFYFILLALHEDEVATQRQLAAAVGIGEATLSHHLSAMAENELIERRRDSSNRRVQQILLTDKGRELYVELRKAIKAFDAHLRSVIGTDQDVNELVQTLLRVADAAEQYVKPQQVGL